MGRASKVLKGSSKQANLLFVGCVGIFLLFVFGSGTGKGVKVGNRHAKLSRDLVHYILIFFEKTND